MRNVLAPLLLAPCILLAACEPESIPGDPAGNTSTAPNTASQAGGGTAPLPGDPNKKVVTVPHCKRVETVLPNADAPIGTIVPRELARQATATLSGQWVEQDHSKHPVARQQITPSANGIQGEVKVAYTNGAVRFVKSEFVDCTPGVACAELGVTCIDEIEIDMDVTMRSDNGVFAESLTGVLAISDPRDPDLHQGEPEEPSPKPAPALPTEYSVTAKIDPIAFAGTATLHSESTRPGFKITRNKLSFNVAFSEGKPLRANLTSMITVTQDPLPGDGSGSVGGAGAVSLYSLEAKP